MSTVGRVPLHLEHDRPFIGLELMGRDGPRSARCWVDSGGGALILAAPLARDLGLPLEPLAGAPWLARTVTPTVALGGLPLDLTDAEILVDLEEHTLNSSVAAECFLGAPVLSRYHVVFDYPRREFTLAVGGALTPRGVAVAAAVSPQSGFIRVELLVAGERRGMLLDTGASFTMFSQALIDRWSTDHPDWPRAEGAVGSANMLGGEIDCTARLLRLPEVAWGAERLAGIGVVSRPVGTFEQYMSQWTTEPVVGAMAGNILKLFRIDIDYPAGAVYLEQHAAPDPHDMDLVGLVLRATPEGGYLIDEVARHDGRPVTKRVRMGDRLLRVDGKEVAGWPLAQVVGLLRGQPAEARTLLLERDGNHFEERIPVTRLL